MPRTWDEMLKAAAQPPRPSRPAPLSWDEMLKELAAQPAPDATLKEVPLSPPQSGPPLPRWKPSAIEKLIFRFKATRILQYELHPIEINYMDRSLQKFFRTVCGGVYYHGGAPDEAVLVFGLVVARISTGEAGAWFQEIVQRASDRIMTRLHPIQQQRIYGASAELEGLLRRARPLIGRSDNQAVARFDRDCSDDARHDAAGRTARLGG